jgi:L,D-transpeptidase catalytic domain
VPRPHLLRIVLLAGVGLLLACSGRGYAASSCTAADARIVVETGAHRLVLCEREREVAAFSVRLGRGGVGKTAEGDGKTPLGTYPLGEPRKSDRYGTFIAIGYPTPDQRRRGFTGGDVGVHGPHRWVRWLGSLVNSFDSSNGCVGLATDREMASIAAWVRTVHAQTIELR